MISLTFTQTHPRFQQPEVRLVKCNGLEDIGESERSNATEALGIVTKKYVEFLLNTFFIAMDSELGKNKKKYTMDDLLDYSRYPLEKWDFELK